MKNLRLAVFSFAVLAMVAAVWAQTLPAGRPTPESIAEKALSAMKEDRIVDFAALMHPDARAQFQKTLLSIAEAADEEGRTAEILPLFDGVRTLEELRALDDAAFFVSFMKGMLKLRPELKDALRATTMKVIGHVPEGEGLVHVVYRGAVATEGVAITKMSVMSLRSTDSGWAMLLTGDIENAANMLRRRFGGE